MGLSHWSYESVYALFEMPFLELLFRAYSVHRESFKESDFELCTLSSIKTGACPEDCSYCPQSGHYKTGLEKEPLLDFEAVISQALTAKANGAKRFCMGAAWKSPPKKDFPAVLKMIEAVKAIGLEACVTLGALDENQVSELKHAGLDYYNHNLDTSPDYYEKIITTRTYEDRLKTISHISNQGIHLCCGGIMGMGETRDDRINFLLTLSLLAVPPKSIPINKLIAIQGTPLEDAEDLDHFEFVRTIAIARIMFPSSYVRLSAGREDMTEEQQALCFMAGANSIFIGDKLLTAGNSTLTKDAILFDKLKMTYVSSTLTEKN